MLLPYLNKDVLEAGCDEVGRGCLAGAVYAGAVIFPIVLRKFFVQTKHVFVPMGFCQDGSGSNSKVFSVAFDNSCVWNIRIFLKTIAVNQ
jgi:hypothetical protein